MDHDDVLKLAKHIAERSWNHRRVLTNDHFAQPNVKMGEFFWKNMNEVQKAYFMVHARAAMEFMKKHYIVMDKE